MKKLWIILLLLGVAICGTEAQNVVFYSPKELAKGKGDTLVHPRKVFVEKRTKNQIMMTGGADYKIDANRKAVRRNLKSRYYAVAIDTALYVNCKRLEYNKFRFGGYYAPTMLIGGKAYFCAAPVGKAAVSIDEDRNIGLGAIGEAISSSTMLSARVYYEIDLETGKVDFMGRDKMVLLLEGHPELKELYLTEDSEEAYVTGKYLLELKKLETR